MNELLKSLQTTPIVYITRDIERALGLPAGRHGLPKAYQNFHIITNATSYSKTVAKNRKNVLLISRPHSSTAPLDTHELLSHPQTKKYLEKFNNPRIVVFKNTTQIENICQANGWPLINPPATLANHVEEKISQIQWLGDLTKYLPPFHIQIGKDLLWSREKYIVQFNRAHTGSGTILIESQQQVDELKKKFPNREMRVSQYIAGPAFTNNNVVWNKKVFIGNINYQITGLPPFTERPFATIGNDWTLPRKLLSRKQVKQYEKIATDVGKQLAKDGWKGLFGIDVIMDEATGKLYLIEINARQPASTTYESQLQEIQKTKKQKNKLTTFEAHLAALTGLPPTTYSLQPIKDGAQVIMKNKEKPISPNLLRSWQTKLQKSKLNVIAYDNTEPESDLLRIQSKKGIMAGHNTFNKIGENIIAQL